MTLQNATLIKSNAFYGSKINTLNLPNVLEIEREGLSVAKVNNLYLPKIETIGPQAFRSGSLTTLWLPASCTTITTPAIADGIFTYCSNMQKVYCEAPSKPSGWGAYWNYNSNKSKYIDVEWGVSYEEYLEKIKEGI